MATPAFRDQIRAVINAAAQWCGDQPYSRKDGFGRAQGLRA